MWRLRAMAAVATIALMAACGTSSTPAANGTTAPGPSSSATQPAGSSQPSAAKTVKPAPVESIPPGDLPDQVAWIHPPTAAGHFQIDVPEGWARNQPSTNDFLYTDNSGFNTLEVSWQAATFAPTLSSARSNEVPPLQQSLQARAFQLVSVTKVSLKAGPAILITYQVNSKPNAVTGKSIGEQTVRYELFKKGEEAVFALTSTVNQDTVDFYNHVKDSFTWL